MSFAQKLKAQRQAIAEQKASFDRAYKFKVGKTVLRILPGVDDQEEFSRRIGAHYIKNPRTNELLAVVGDASICYNKPNDPVRDLISEVVQTANDRGDKDLADAAKSWLAKENYVLEAHIEGGVDTENKGKVVRVELSPTNYDAILSSLEDLSEVDPDFEMSRGVMVTVEREGTGVKDTRYKFSLFPKQPDKPVPESVLSQRMGLETYINSKFGSQVTRALQNLSAILGRDVSSHPVGAALTATAQIADQRKTEVASSASGAKDAEFEPINDEVPDFDENPAASADSIDDILADLNNL